MTILYKTQYDKEFYNINTIYYWKASRPDIRNQISLPSEYNYKIVYYPDLKHIWIESTYKERTESYFEVIDRVEIYR